MESDGFDQYEEDQEAYYVEFLRSKGYEITPPKPKWSDYIESRAPYQQKYINEFGAWYTPHKYWKDDCRGGVYFLEVGEMSWAKDRILFNAVDLYNEDMIQVYLNKNDCEELELYLARFLANA